MMLMISKIKVCVGTLLTSILIISMLGTILFLILNRNQKLKYLKKMTSVALILTMLLLPFSNLLDVKAEGTIISASDTKLLERDKNFKYVTNTTNILLNNVGEYNEEDATKMDTFSAYKILDVYYNETTNEMTYDFTSDFNTFKKSLDSNDEIYKLDVSGYLELTGDSSSSVDTSLTLNKLVSKYATYIRKQTSGTLSSIKLGQGNKSTGRIASNVEVGSYLILPDNVVEEKKNAEGPSASSTFMLFANTYTVLVGNAVFTTENGEWTLTDCNVEAKKDYDNFLSILIDDGNVNNLNNDMENGKYANDMVYNTKNGMIFFNLGFNDGYDGNWDFPANTHDSIKNSTKINEQLRRRKFIFSSGLDIKNIYISGDGDTFQKLTIRDNAAYFISKDNTEQKFADIVKNYNELDIQGRPIGKSITFSRITQVDATLLFEIAPNSNANVGIDATHPENSGNKIITEMTYLKDPYMDIGTKPTDEVISKVLGVFSNTNIVYTYGMTVTNEDNNSNILSGAEFQLYSDKECTIPVGDKIVIGTDGNAIFKGMNDTDTYYLKQVKAVTGYRLMTDVIEVSKDKLSLTNGLYNLTITNTKMGLFPSTGGLGTILYTLVGLLVIGVGSTMFIKYRQKQVQN